MNTNILDCGDNPALTSKEFSEKRGKKVFRAKNITNLNFKNVKIVGEQAFLSGQEPVGAEKLHRRA